MRDEVNYFDIFIKLATVCHEAAQKLDDLINDYTGISKKVDVIRNIEHSGDELYHELYYHLNRSFITPIERDDIIDIARNIEDTIDIIEDVSNSFDVFSVTKIRSDAKEMSTLILKNCSLVVSAAQEFKNFKKSGKLSKIFIEINNIEGQGDVLHRNIIKKLFVKEKDAVEVLKWNTIYNKMEDVLDACERIADIMDGVIIKNS